MTLTKEEKLKEAIQKEWDEIYPKFAESCINLVNKAGGLDKICIRDDTGKMLSRLRLDFTHF